MKKLVSLLLALVMLAGMTCAAQADTFTAAAKGFGGDVTVTVTFEGEKIASIEAKGDSETVGIGSIAVANLPAAIVEHQSLLVDTVAGATVSSNAVLAAVKDCIAQAGLSEDAFAKEIVKTAGETVRYETDVVVVGGGLSGMAAAVSASTNGASVIMLEKMPMTGGSAKSSKGSFMVAELPENGYSVTGEGDTLDAALARWKEKQDADSVAESIYPDYERLAHMLVQSGRTCEWIEGFGGSFTKSASIADKGMLMLQVDIDGDANMTAAGRLMAKFEAIAKENGAQILTNTPATELIVDGDKIVGVKASGADGEVEVYAGSVILACGGFISNQDMLFKYMPQLYNVTGIGVVGNTGDGIAMATAVGAAEMESAWLVPCWIAPAPEFFAVNPLAGVFQDSSSPIDESATSYNRLVINKKGERFMNEAAQYAKQVLNLTYMGDHPYYAVYDNLSPVIAEIADSGLETGKVFKADTLADLAAQAGIDSAAFEATVARYNEMCAAGEDKDFGKDASRLTAIGENGPYYLVEMVPAGSDTIGGVKTNWDYQVLRADGSVIEGLYAVGSMSNGAMYNQYYFSGSALTFAATSGRIAGAHAAAK